MIFSDTQTDAQDFNDISGMPFMELEYNGQVIRYVLTGFQNLEEAVAAVTNAYLRRTGFNIFQEYTTTLNNTDFSFRSFHFHDQSGKEGILRMGILAGKHLEFVSPGITKSKKMIQEQYNLVSPKNNVETVLENGNTEEKQAQEVANVSLWIAPCDAAGAQTILKSKENSTADLKLDVHMGTAILSKKNLEAITRKSTDPDALKKALYEARFSYNSRHGSEWFLYLVAGLYGEPTIHVMSGSTRGNEAYFTCGEARHLGYRKFTQQLSNFIHVLEHKGINETNLIENKNDFLEAFETFQGKTPTKAQEDDIATSFLGLKNTYYLLKTMQEKYGEEITELMFHSMDASDYGAFWFHDGHAVNAKILYLQKAGVTRIERLSIGTDLFKDVDDLLAFLSITEEFLQYGTVGGIPCDNIDFHSAVDVKSQRAWGTEQFLNKLEAWLIAKYPYNEDSLKEKKNRIQILPGSEAALNNGEHSYYACPNGNPDYMPVSSDKKPAINVGGMASIYLIEKNFQKFCDKVGIEIETLDVETKSFYQDLYNMWHSNDENVSCKDFLSQDDFDAMSKDLRKTLNNQNKNEKIPHADVCEVIKDVFNRFSIKLAAVKSAFMSKNSEMSMISTPTNLEPTEEWKKLSEIPNLSASLKTHGFHPDVNKQNLNLQEPDPMIENCSYRK